MILSWVLGHGTQIVSTVTQFSLQCHESIHCGVLKKQFYEAHKRQSHCTDKHTQATYPGRNAKRRKPLRSIQWHLFARMLLLKSPSVMALHSKNNETIRLPALALLFNVLSISTKMLSLLTLNIWLIYHTNGDQKKKKQPIHPIQK